MKTLCVATIAAALLLGGCAGRTSSTRTPPPPPPPATAETVTPQSSMAELGPGDALLIAAGDIADCSENRGAEAKATAAVIAGFPDATVIAAGDIAYENGETTEFGGCYDKVWGAHKARTRPAPGNHDYGIYNGRNNITPYLKYFGANADPLGNGKGFYSFDLGSWHIVSLNSMAGQVPAAPTRAEQVKWLETDLKATKQPCILAYWHHPLFTSGEHGDDKKDPGRKTTDLWKVLQDHGADVIVNGHDHNYERFAPQSRTGTADPDGIREFVVGTGGISLRSLGTKRANSEKFLANNAIDHGVLLMTLHPNGYEWKFLRTNGTVGDASTGTVDCHP